VTVKARADFEYRGRAIRAGRVFRMDALDAAVAARKHLVSLSSHPGLSLTSLQPEPEPRRRYRRRDLVAEE
jgi:hypothetical protein